MLYEVGVSTMMEDQPYRVPYDCWLEDLPLTPPDPPGSETAEKEASPAKKESEEHPEEGSPTAGRNTPTSPEETEDQPALTSPSQQAGSSTPKPALFYTVKFCNICHSFLHETGDCPPLDSANNIRASQQPESPRGSDTTGEMDLTCYESLTPELPEDSPHKFTPPVKGSPERDRPKEGQTSMEVQVGSSPDEQSEGHREQRTMTPVNLSNEGAVVPPEHILWWPEAPGDLSTDLSPFDQVDNLRTNIIMLEQVLHQVPSDQLEKIKNDASLLGLLWEKLPPFYR